MSTSSNLSQLIRKATTCNFAGDCDKAGRWHPSTEIAIEYCRNYRPPSRAWPYSYRGALSSIKANVALNVITAEQARIVRAAKRLLARLGDPDVGIEERGVLAQKLELLRAQADKAL